MFNWKELVLFVDQIITFFALCNAELIDDVAFVPYKLTNFVIQFYFETIKSIIFNFFSFREGKNNFVVRFVCSENSVAVKVFNFNAFD